MAGDSSASAGATAPHLSRGRRITIWTLIVLASLIGILSILASWINRQLLDTSSWNKTSTQLIQNDTIRSSLSVYLVNQLYDNVDVAGAFEQRLPPNLQALAAPAAAALRQPASNGVDALLARPRVQATFITASTLAHEKMINVLENKTGNGIDTGNGVVTLDLSELVTQLGQQLGLPSAALAKIPPGTGVITIMRSDQLGTAQSIFQAIKILSVWLLVLVLVMYGIALYLAAGIRRETLRNIGWAFVLVGLVVVVARAELGKWAVHALTQPPNRPPANEAWKILTTTLGDIGWAVVLYGAIAVIGAVLAGPTRAATSVRRWIAPTLNERPGVAWASAGFVYLLLIFWGGTHALRTVWGILLLGALLALGIWAFRRETLREFPVAHDASAEPPPPPAPPAPPAAAAAGSSQAG
jgi:hypothetical protein